MEGEEKERRYCWKDASGNGDFLANYLKAKGRNIPMGFDTGFHTRSDAILQYCDQRFSYSILDRTLPMHLR